jgi:hypothetical protein
MAVVLVGCEVSQMVTLAFEEKGHEAFSCDLKPCTGWRPDIHLQMNVFDALLLRHWDLVIVHPPCTYTAISGNRWYHKSDKRRFGAQFTANLWAAAGSVCDCVALEQPRTVVQSVIGKKSQSIHPWQFGHGETKETWLWLKGLPLLTPTDIVDGRVPRIWKMSPNVNRQELRSTTYPGIAAAMADQWGKLFT